MFSYVRKVFGAISVREERGIVTVDGVPTYLIRQDIQKLWRTSKIGNNIFLTADGSSLSFYSFFALEVDYAINRLLEEKTARVSRNTLRKLSDALREQTWIYRLHGNRAPDEHEVVDFNRVTLNYQKLSKFHKSPLDYQRRFFNEFETAINILQLRGYILAGAPGSGKTLMGLCLGEMLEVDHIVVICPKNAIFTVWDESAKKEYRHPVQTWAAAAGKPYRDEKILIFHYESLTQAETMVRALKGRLLVIVDESHNLTTETSQRTTKFTRLCQSLPRAYIVWASGTPFKAMGSESIPIFQSIDPLFNDDVAGVFRKIYGKDAKTGLDILNHRITQVTTTIEKKELGLQPPIIQTLPVTIPDAGRYTLDSIAKVMKHFIIERKAYYADRKEQDQALFRTCLRSYEHTIHNKPAKQAGYQHYLSSLQAVIGAGQLSEVSDDVIYCNRFENEEIIPALSKDYREDFREVRAIIKYVDLKIRGECLGRILGKLRIECVQEMARHIDYLEIIESTERKTVIFASNVEPLLETERVVKALRQKPLIVYADTNANLNQIIERFRLDPDANPMIATFNSLSTAVPLVEADTMLMLNVPFRAYVYDQAIARIHRLGQTNQTTIYVASLDTGSIPNISTRTVDILAWSQNQVEQILGIESPYDVKDQTIAIEEIRLEAMGLESYLPEEVFR